jgi:hypothetical protein
MFLDRRSHGVHRHLILKTVTNGSHFDCSSYVVDIETSTVLPISPVQSGTLLSAE